MSIEIDRGVDEESDSQCLQLDTLIGEHLEKCDDRSQSEEREETQSTADTSSDKCPNYSTYHAEYASSFRDIFLSEEE
jgi:hypothetical protein